MSPKHQNHQDYKNRRVAGTVIVAVVAMLALSYASVPLYALFCQVTGYGGTPQTARANPQNTGDRTLLVRFDANVAPNLPWSFVTETSSLNVRVGETITVFFRATNLSHQTTKGIATYNVTPDVVGGFFNKISCFCFNEQTLSAGETLEFPVVFFLDPALEQDADMKRVESITLSYTFFAPKKPITATISSLVSPKL